MNPKKMMRKQKGYCYGNVLGTEEKTLEMLYGRKATAWLWMIA